MPSGGLAGSATGAGSIGRYFTVVSLVPSSVFVAYLLLLVRSEAWSGEVRLAGALGELELKDAAVLGMASLLLALAVHPLQYALVQLFEGYWGSSRLTVAFAFALTIRHRCRAVSLDLKAAYGSRIQRQARLEDPDVDSQLLRTFIAGQEAHRLVSTSYPQDLDLIMPTRLGNVLRHFEILAGDRYGLRAIETVPRIAMVAQPRHVEYVENQRIQMELAVRTSFLGLVASVLTAAFMWGNGLWMLLTLAPYLVAYLAYRGAVIVAREYGTALATLIDLNRFALYERLRLPIPEDIEEERELNGLLAEVLRLDRVEFGYRLRHEMVLDYVHPEPPLVIGIAPSSDSGVIGPAAGVSIRPSTAPSNGVPSRDEPAAASRRTQNESP